MYYLELFVAGNNNLSKEEIIIRNRVAHRNGENTEGLKITTGVQVARTSGVMGSECPRDTW